MKFKHRKQVFLVLVALLAGVSLAFYQTSEMNWLLLTIALIPIQLGATLIIYFACFWNELLHSDKQPFSE
jgi:1,4-dihydroxy-2-naphthoate octaprenyltransferase